MGVLVRIFTDIATIFLRRECFDAKKRTMPVERCRACGFCDGVRRAVAIAEDLSARGWSVFVDGELVHNESVSKQLRAKNVHVWNGESRRWGKNDCLLIRAHGVSPERRRLLREIGCPIFDATCPEVAKLAGQITQLRRTGYFIFLFGEKQHPEVLGLAGYAQNALCICNDASEIESVSKALDRQPVALLAQSTSDLEQFRTFAKEFQKIFPKGQILETICRSTRERQEELLQKLRKDRYDYTVVVGGLHSANARNLARMAERNGTCALHVDGVEMLRTMANFSTGDRILLSAGASTPDADIFAVEAFIHSATASTA
jgi:4-hydroxy-3-methylbut-2-enyl diphosphate reductase